MTMKLNLYTLYWNYIIEMRFEKPEIKYGCEVMYEYFDL